ncbi:MAG: hypothetical protein ABIX01_05440 [Chitinophagaceae bacterium]
MTRFFFLITALGFSYFAGAQNVGIGTTTPAAKLDIIGSLKITDGTQGANKILTSGPGGLATWTAPPAPACFLLATGDPVSSSYYIGLGSSSSNFTRSCIVVPFNCELTSLVFSTKDYPSPTITATVWRRTPPGTAVATSLSATVTGPFTTYAVATGSVLLNQGDLISIQVSGTLVSGIAASVTYK